MRIFDNVKTDEEMRRMDEGISLKSCGKTSSDTVKCDEEGVHAKRSRLE